MVNDLLQLFHGVNITIQGKVLQLNAIISLIACDIPATCNVLGLPGHSAKYSCSKCLKKFPVANFGEKSKYSVSYNGHWSVSI